MTQATHVLGDRVKRIRSKNAGPFWITIDIFCGDTATFQRTLRWLDLQAVSRRFRLPAEFVEQYEIPSLNVIKLSYPRQVVQGDIRDRDIHGAQAAVVLAEMEADDF